MIVLEKLKFNMNKVVLVLTFIYFILTPFYIFPSGLPQPADYLVIISILVFFLFGSYKKVYNYKITKDLKVLLLVIFLVNLGNQFYLANKGIDGRPLFAVLFYIFNFSFLMMVIAYIDYEKYKNIISISILSSVALQCFLLILGIGNLTGGRETAFFNNPNQLGYFGLLSLSIFSVNKSKLRSSTLVSISMICFSAFLVLMSGSRAALFGILLLALFLFIEESLKFNLRYFIGVIFISIISIFLLNYNYIEDRLNKIQARNESRNSTISSEWETRGYSRMMYYPEFLFFGAGEGGNLRFIDTNNDHEMHSAFGTMLFSYGILGFILFIRLIFRIIVLRPWHNMLILLPVLVYNISHQGLRVTMFWVLLGILYSNSVQYKFKLK